MGRGGRWPQGLGLQGKPVGCRGPRRSPGSAHLYFFRLYALDTALALPPRRRKADLLKALAGHLLVRVDLIERYQRPSGAGPSEPSAPSGRSWRHFRPRVAPQQARRASRQARRFVRLARCAITCHRGASALRVAEEETRHAPRAAQLVAAGEPDEPWTGRCMKEKIADDSKRHRCRKPEKHGDNVHACQCSVECKQF